MYKKALLAVAISGLFAGTASSADLTLYGVVDYGMQYLNEDVTHFQDKFAERNDFLQSSEALTMESGINAGSRFGLKGTEKLGNGYTVSFTLENGFTADDGKLDNGDRIFGREASLTLGSERFGALSFGRMGGVGSATGSYDTTFAIGDAFDGGSQKIVGMAVTERYDNMLAYRSPTFYGMQATLQYSFKNDSSKDADNEWEGHASADRYAAFALTGSHGKLRTAVSYEQIMYSDTVPSKLADSTYDPSRNDTKIASVGANYDFGVAKVFGMAQYYEGLRSVNGRDIEEDAFLPIGDSGYSFPEGVEGYALHLGTQAPLYAGTLTAGLYYADFELDTAKKGDAVKTDGEFIGAAAQYNYPLSSRTELYAGIGYGLTTIDAVTKKHNDYEIETTQAFAGVTHRF